MLRLKVGTAGDVPAVPVQATVWRDHDGSVAARGFTVDGDHWMQLPGVGSFRFSEGCDEVTSFADPGASRDIVLDAYRRAVLPMALQALGWEVLHASAVRMQHGVIALCAVSETGKSTVACALGMRGHGVFADDAVPIDLSAATPQAIALPFELRLRPESASFFGASGRAVEKADGEAAPLAALCLLERANPSDPGGPVRVVRLSPTASFPRILAHAYCFSLESPARRGSMVERYLELVSRVPVFEVVLWPGLNNLGSVVDAIEGTVSPGAA